MRTEKKKKGKSRKERKKKMRSIEKLFPPSCCNRNDVFCGQRKKKRSGVIFCMTSNNQLPYCNLCVRIQSYMCAKNAHPFGIQLLLYFLFVMFNSPGECPLLSFFPFGLTAAAKTSPSYAFTRKRERERDEGGRFDFLLVVLIWRIVTAALLVSTNATNERT